MYTRRGVQGYLRMAGVNMNWTSLGKVIWIYSSDSQNHTNPFPEQFPLGIHPIHRLRYVANDIGLSLLHG